MSRSKKRAYFVSAIFALVAVLGPHTAAQDPETLDPLETFEPSEKVPADSAVAFPVDI